MADQKRKIATIRSLENLKLSPNLIEALEDATQAEHVAIAIDYLESFSQEWN